MSVLGVHRQPVKCSYGRSPANDADASWATVLAVSDEARRSCDRAGVNAQDVQHRVGANRELFWGRDRVAAQV